MPKVITFNGHPAYHVHDIPNPSRFHCPVCGGSDSWTPSDLLFMKGIERRVFSCSECGKALVVDDLGMPCIRWASPDGRWAVLVKGGATIVLRSVDGTRRIVPCSMRNEEATCPPEADVPPMVLKVASRLQRKSKRLNPVCDATTAPAMRKPVMRVISPDGCIGRRCAGDA